ncbi:unnamed protein product, partial [Didymodactylos carnosus]
MIVIALIPVYLKRPSMHERLPITNPVSVEPVITKSQLGTSTTTFRLTDITAIKIRCFRFSAIESSVSVIIEYEVLAEVEIPTGSYSSKYYPVYQNE